jgi:hypothetical protein
VTHSLPKQPQMNCDDAMPGKAPDRLGQVGDSYSVTRKSISVARLNACAVRWGGHVKDPTADAQLAQQISGEGGVEIDSLGSEIVRPMAGCLAPNLLEDGTP